MSLVGRVAFIHGLQDRHLRVMRQAGCAATAEPIRSANAWACAVASLMQSGMPTPRWAAPVSAMPQYNLGHPEILASLTARLAAHPGIARVYRWPRAMPSGTRPPNLLLVQVTAVSMRPSAGGMTKPRPTCLSATSLALNAREIVALDT